MPVPMSASEIADDLADRILGGEYKPGQRLPSYQELANLYGVSTSTITGVVIRLKERGLVVGAQGRGVFIPEKD